MTNFVYHVEFMDDETGESFVSECTYPKEMEWQEIWDGFLKTGRLQMVPHSMWVEEEEDE